MLFIMFCCFTLTVYKNNVLLLKSKISEIFIAEFHSNGICLSESKLQNWCPLKDENLVPEKTKLHLFKIGNSPY